MEVLYSFIYIKTHIQFFVNNPYPKFRLNLHKYLNKGLMQKKDDNRCEKMSDRYNHKDLIEVKGLEQFHKY